MRRYLSHLAGLVLAGAMVGAVLGSMGALLALALGPTILWTLGGLALVGYGLADLRVLRLPRAGLAKQVPREWMRRYPAVRVYFAYGLLLGTGFLTTTPFATFTGVLLVELGSASAVTGATIGAAYGLGRGLAVLLVLAEAARIGFSTRFIPPLLQRAAAWRSVLGTLSIVAGSALIAQAWIV